MIGIITGTKGWIWLALYLGVFLEWFVSLNIYIIDTGRKSGTQCLVCVVVFF